VQLLPVVTTMLGDHVGDSVQLLPVVTTMLGIAVLEVLEEFVHALVRVRQGHCWCRVTTCSEAASDHMQ
jgi:hypothetical protein